MTGSVSPSSDDESNEGTTVPPAPQRVGFVHDWLPVYAGAERVLEQMICEFPDAELYSLIDFIPEGQRDFLQGTPVNTSFLQHLPFVRHAYRYYLPLAPLAIEQFDLSDHDVVVSSSYAVAKGALTRSDQLHVSYVHSPIRYAWDLYHDYLRAEGVARRIRNLIARVVLHYIRLYDVATAPRVDVFVANSHHVARRIWNTYRRRAHVVYPPVDVGRFSVTHDSDDYYLTVSRLVSYKSVDLLVQAFNGMPSRRLVVIGDGPESDRLERMAGSNVTMLGYRSDEEVARRMADARAFLFAAEEDFGIVPVEAQACGTPVVAYGHGGVRETVIAGTTGIFFDEKTADSVQAAVRRFEDVEERFDPAEIRANAERFGIDRFRSDFGDLVRSAYARFRTSSSIPPASDLHDSSNAPPPHAELSF